jgi:hypothetical protein
MDTNSMRWSALRQRVHTDFFMRSRMGEYRALLEKATAEGYTFCSLRRFLEMSRRGQPPAPRYILLRHDVDTGVRTAQAMWSIEQMLGINGSYYFRLRTVSPRFMRAIEEQGGEASYHFEEVSTLAKNRRIRTREETLSVLRDARDLFARNLLDLRNRTGLRMEIVAGHGDWINRKLGVQNSEILASSEFREVVGVELEAYDGAVMDAVLKHSDGPPPSRWLWDDRDPTDSIRSGVAAMQILVHPRHWRTEPFENFIDNATRCAEALRHRWIQ